MDWYCASRSKIHPYRAFERPCLSLKSLKVSISISVVVTVVAIANFEKILICHVVTSELLD